LTQIYMNLQVVRNADMFYPYKTGIVGLLLSFIAKSNNATSFGPTGVNVADQRLVRLLTLSTAKGMDWW
jgi:hypothetical protein